MRLRGDFAPWLAVASLLMGAACQTVPTTPAQEAAVENRAADPESPSATGEIGAAQPVPPEVRDALLPPLRAPALGDRKEPEPRFDVAVRDAPARDFFLGLVEGTPYDVVLHPAVRGEISLTLKDATVPEILAAVREVYGFDYHATSGGFYVLPAQLRSRIFHLDYLDAQREGQSQIRVSSGQLTDQVGGGDTRTPLMGPTTTGRERVRGVLESSQVKTQSESDLWQELAASLRAIIGPGDDRSVVVSPQAGIVVVRAMPDELRHVEEFLRQAESNLERQVILDIKILEVELAEGFRTGINWAQLIVSGSKSGLFAQTGGGSLFESGQSEIAGNTGTLDPDSFVPPSNTDTSAFGGVFSAALDISKFTAFVELLETQGEVHVLSSPRVSTVNNQKAVIKVGQDEFFVTDVSTTTVTGTATTTSPQVTLTPFFSGIALDVLPQISPEGDVTLHVHPSISRVDDQVKEIALGADTLSLPLALSTIRETDAIVRARSGQVVVIGGLIQDLRDYGRGSIPWLGRVPYLGNLFGHRFDSSSKSELVILLRPQVVEEDTWKDEVERSQRRIGDGRYGAGAPPLFGADGWSAEP